MTLQNQITFTFLVAEKTINKVVVIYKIENYILAAHLDFISNLHKHHWVISLKISASFRNSYGII